MKKKINHSKATVKIAKTHSVLPTTLSLNLSMRQGDFFALFPLSTLGEKLIRKIFSYFSTCFEKHFEVKVYVEPPENIQNINPELWKLLHLGGLYQKEGVISVIKKRTGYNDEPNVYSFEARLPGNVREGFHGIGYSFFSEQEALVTSLGEAIERHCFLHFTPPSHDILDSTYKEIAGEAIDPFLFAGISEVLRKQNVNPDLRPFTHDNVFRWIQGTSLTQKRKVWLPLQSVTANPSIEKELGEKGERLLRYAVSTGAASGEGPHDALYRAICEIVERDAYMITYLNCISPSKLHIEECSKEIQTIAKNIDKHNLTLQLLYLPTDVPCHVVMAILLPRSARPIDRPYFALGMKADLDINIAIRGALNEALNSRIGMKTMLRDIPEPFGPNPDEAEKIGQDERIYLWQTRPELIDKVQFLWSGKYIAMKEVPVFEMHSASFAKKLQFLIDHFKKHNMEVAYIENTTPAVRRVCKKVPGAFRSFFAIIPEMQPMHLYEEAACLAGERIKKVPKKLGIEVDDKINTMPHPFP